jgi:hypothetical protein
MIQLEGSFANTTKEINQCKVYNCCLCEAKFKQHNARVITGNNTIQHA